MSDKRPRRRRATLLIAVGLALLASAPAQAVHWPFFGGDNGHSGYQPVDEGTTPLSSLYAKTAATEQFVKSSIITTTGAPANQRLIFGTNDGRIHLQLLASGAPLGDEAGIDVSEGNDLDVFGTRDTDPGENGSSVSFADTSVATGLGQIFAVHNDDDATLLAPDIEVAQIDETTGTRVRADVDVAGTDGFTIQSSVVASGPGTGGARTLFFVASNGTDQRLFRVPVDGNAQTTGGTVNGATATNTGDIDATPLASPTFMFRDVGGTPTPFVIVGTTPNVRSYAASDLAPGPASVPLGGPVQTPSVPVQPDGMTPNPAGAVRTAPLVYVATATGGATTTAYELNGQTLTVQETSEALEGAPAPALATDLESEPTLEEAKVFVTTGENLFFLTSDGLDRAGQFVRDAANLDPGSTGFQQTTAAGSGDSVYVANDQGEQFVLRLGDAQPVSASEFTSNAGATPLPNTGVGQPSLTRGFVQFASGRGVFVYRNTDATAPSVSLVSPSDGSTLRGSAAVSATAFDARGVASVAFRLNGRVVATDTGADAGSPFGAPGATYSGSVDTGTLADGEYVFDAVVTDASGLTTTSGARRVTIDNVADVTEDNPPTVVFTAPAANAVIKATSTVSATATDDRGVRSVSFFDDDRLICTDTTAPYSCPFAARGDDVGRDTLFAIATDTTGQTAAAIRTVRVARFAPRGVTARVTPARDRSRPYRFVTSGTVRLPTEVTRATGCTSGLVSVKVKRGSRTISTRQVALGRDCRFRSTVTFSGRSRLGRLKVAARFLGNDVLTALSSPSRTVRAG